MANFNENPEFVPVRQLDRTDDCLADVFNESFEALVQRDGAVKEMVETETTERQSQAGALEDKTVQGSGGASTIKTNAEALATAPYVDHADAAQQEQINALSGRGGPITAADLGDPTLQEPTLTQQSLTEYACQQIWGAGGVFAWNADSPGESTYTLNETVHNAKDIFNSTWVRNTNANDLNHKWVLANTPDTDPVVFEWINTGVDTVSIATEPIAGLVTSGGDVNVDPVTGKMSISEQGLSGIGSSVGGGGTDGGSALFDESKCRNLLDVLGIRAVHSDDPATAEEAAAAFAALHERINADGDPTFAGLRLGDYLDLPSINDGTTTYTWNASYKNLRVMISGFNTYKGSGDTEVTKNHILFTFRNCVLTKRMNATDTNTGGYAATEMNTYLNGVFKTGLQNVIGNYLLSIRRLISTKGSWAWKDDTVFLPTERETWGTCSYGEQQWDAGVPIQWPIFRDSMVYKIKRYNGSRQWWWNASPSSSSAAYFCSVDSTGYAGSGSASAAGGCAPAFCVA
jgi:hypothetical protein